MDRYGASSSHYDNEYSDSYDSRPADSDPGYGRSRRGAAEPTRRGAPPMRSRYADSESDDDENYGRRRVRSARDRNTFEGERAGLDFGSRLETTDSRRAPHGTSDRRDVVPHASDEFPPNERAQVPREVRSRRDARIEGRRFDEDSYGVEAVVDSATRHGTRMPRGDVTPPPPPGYYGSDSETELGGRHVRAPGTRRGAEPRSRFDDDHSGRRGTRGEHGRGDRRRMEPRSGGNPYDTTSSDDESDSTSDGYNLRSRY